jgi:hypothetical protein
MTSTGEWRAMSAQSGRFNSLPGVSVETAPGEKMTCKGPIKTQILPVQRFGNDVAFVSLPRLGAVAGFSINFDNNTKVVKLVKID